MILIFLLLFVVIAHSGMMVAYILLRDLEKSKGRFNPVLLYLHRYIRLTPPFAVAIAIAATIMPKLYAGPHWGGARASGELCRLDWWRPLLYVQTIPSLAPEIPFELLTESSVGCIGQVMKITSTLIEL